MLGKKTVIFFTDRYNTAVAENIRAELPKDAVSVIVTKKELGSFVYNALKDKSIPEKTAFRAFLRNLRQKILAYNFDKTIRQKIVYRKTNGVQRHVLNVLYRFEPDLVVVTGETILGDVLAGIDARGKIKCVVAGEEFVLDKRIIHRNADYYFVDNFDMREKLVRSGVPESKIEITPLPVGRKFFDGAAPDELRKKFFLSEKPVILVACSVMADGRFRKVLSALAACGIAADFLVACGKNRDFLNFAKDLGFAAYNETLDMNEALNVCDLAIARPTTMFLAEAMAKKKPIFSLFPNGKIERANLGYLSLDRITDVKDIPTLCRKTAEFVENLTAREGESTIPEERSAEETSAKRIADKLLELIERPEALSVPEEEDADIPSDAEPSDAESSSAAFETENPESGERT